MAALIWKLICDKEWGNLNVRPIVSVKSSCGAIPILNHEPSIILLLCSSSKAGAEIIFLDSPSLQTPPIGTIAAYKGS